jgi:CheY-like chemotaxis protein
MKQGPIVIVDDDEDDILILKEIFADLGVRNKVQWFATCPAAFDYLLQTAEQPFLILSDVNLPGQDGISFKQDIDNNQVLRNKSIPFIFYSTYVDQRVVTKAYTEMTVQGFFKKGNSYEKVRSDVKLIIDYWMSCRHPNNKE